MSFFKVNQVPATDQMNLQQILKGRKKIINLNCLASCNYHKVLDMENVEMYVIIFKPEFICCFKLDYVTEMT